jgi:hypothetical protein
LPQSHLHPADRELLRQRCENLHSHENPLARFENGKFLFTVKKHSSLRQRWRCSCKFKSLRIASCF